MAFDTNVPGWMTEYELGFLGEWATLVPVNGTVVEIGSFMGRSSVAWAMSCDPSVKIYCGDIFYEHFTQNHPFSLEEAPYAPISGHEYNTWVEFQKNTEKFKNIIPMRGTAPLESNYNQDPIDLLFVDAAHSNPSDWDTIKYFAQFVKVGGFITGHDHSEHYPDVVENAKRLSAMYGSPLKIIEFTMLWSVEVTKPYSAEDFI